MQEKVYDYLIAGQGLAGTAMAVELLQLGKSVHILGSPDKASASMAAAGIFNPITGRRWVTTWRASEIFNFFPKFYKSLEKLTGTRFYHEVDIYRSFGNKQEQNDWVNTPLDEIPPFVKEIIKPNTYKEYIHDNYGGLLLNSSGYLNVPLFLNQMKSYFIQKGLFSEQTLELENIKWSTPFQVGEMRAKNFILCLGYGGTRMTPFGEKPFRTVKGELLEVEISLPMPPVIFNGPVFILPQWDGYLKIGATYDFHDDSPTATEQARHYLLDKLRSYFVPEVKVTNQMAGIRPSSVDRRPAVGEHPDIKNLYILNGLGTKGVSLAPYMAKLLVDKLENGKELDREIEIKRFFK